MNNKRTGILYVIVITILLIAIISLISSTDFKKYSYMTIDELIEEKYNKYNCEYIESGRYYFILGTEKSNLNRGFDDIVYYNPNNEFVFFKNGPFPLIFKFKNLDIKYAVTSFQIYRDKDTYVIYVWEAFPDDSLIISDNDKLWPNIKDKNSGIKNWFNVISSLDDNYVITIEEEGKTIATITKDDIEALFS